MIESIVNRKWGALFLMCALSILCVKGGVFALIGSLLSLIGYLSVSHLGRLGLGVGVAISIALGVYGVLASDQILLPLFFAATTLSSYVTVALEQQGQMERFEQEAQEHQALQKAFEEVKKVAFQTKRALQEELKLHEGLLAETKRSLHEALIEKEKACELLRELESKCYLETRLDTYNQDPEELEEFQRQNDLLQEEVEGLREALFLSERGIEDLEAKLYIAEREKEEEIEAAAIAGHSTSQTLSSLAKQCEMLEAHTEALQDLAGAFIPFGKTQLKK